MSNLLSRRGFILGSGAVALGGSAALAACSSDEKPGLRIASWPLYLEDDANPQSSPTIKGFTAATGLKVSYKTIVDGNDSFTTKYEGDLKAGKSIGFDVVVLTSWMCSKWIANGWAEKIPAELVPNKANMIDRLKSPSWDKNRDFSMPYTIGQIGLAYYPDQAGEVTSLKDLLKPELKGKVTILSEMRDCVSLFLQMAGVDPLKATVAESLAAIEVIKKARAAGQFRKITGNGYIEDLRTGDTAACMAWSGDVASIALDKPDLKWVVPKEGGSSFTDTMMIPKGGNVEAAAKWMNYLYDAKVSAPLFQAISYASPVTGAAQFMSPEAQANPLINPPADANLQEFRDLTDAEAEELSKAFAIATEQ
jgi:spermidine/putrescine transport system substrate-binding protein